MRERERVDAFHYLSKKDGRRVGNLCGIVVSEARRSPTQEDSSSRQQTEGAGDVGTEQQPHTNQRESETAAAQGRPVRILTLKAMTRSGGTSTEGATAAAPKRLKKGDAVVYKPLGAHKYRAAAVLSVARNGDGVKVLFHNGKYVTDVETNMSLIRRPTAEERAELSRHWDDIWQHPAASSLASAKGPKGDRDDDGESAVEHEPFYAYLQRLNWKAPAFSSVADLRVMTWNVKHYGARSRVPRDAEAREQRAIHDDERSRNLAEVIFQSRCHLVVLQEIAKAADLAALCALVCERDPSASAGAWSFTAVVGEHAMLYRADKLAAALGGGGDGPGLRVEAGLYARGETLSPAFRRAYDWAAVAPRFDFALQGASAARPPAFFFAHTADGAGAASASRSIALCSVHLAFTAKEVRAQQLSHLASLMPGPSYDARQHIFVLLGDFNSNASVASRGHDLASSAVGDEVMEAINASSPGHELALQPGEKTSVGGERYDEIICHASARGRRHAHVFPPRERVQPQLRTALPTAELGASKRVEQAFYNIFSDHLPVFLDVAFVPVGPRQRAHPGEQIARGQPSAAAAAHIARAVGGGGVAATPDKDALLPVAAALTDAPLGVAAGAEAPVDLEKAAAPPPPVREQGVGEEGALSPGMQCKNCTAGKGCRWRGRPGHAPAVSPAA